MNKFYGFKIANKITKTETEANHRDNFLKYMFFSSSSTFLGMFLSQEFLSVEPN